MIKEMDASSVRTNFVLSLMGSKFILYVCYVVNWKKNIAGVHANLDSHGRDTVI